MVLLGTSVNFTFAFNGTFTAVVDGIFLGRYQTIDEELRTRNISWIKTIMGATQEYVIQVPATLR